MWEFNEVLQQDLAILLVMAAGALACLLHMLERTPGLATLNALLFKFTLPASVVLGLGLKTDLYDSDIWRFVGAFLILRAATLLGCTLLFGGVLRRSLGEVTANWLCTTWISTVIMGTPLLRALLGPQYAPLGVVAGISSYIFQLPLMLVMLEVHSWRQDALPQQQQPQVQHADLVPGEETIAAEGQHLGLAVRPAAGRSSSTDGGSAHGRQPQLQQQQLPGGTEGAGSAGEGAAPVAFATASPAGQEASAPVRSSHVQAAPASWCSRAARQLGRMRTGGKQRQRLGLRLLMNHVLWGVGLGAVLSLSKIGPKWLNPGNPPLQPNPTFCPWTGFLYLLLEYFARCTEPIAFFATGMWMVGRSPLACGAWQSAAYMAAKLMLVPTLMVGCCFVVGLSGATARSAVLLATLPISPAAFALCKTYGVGEPIAVSNVFLGNVLVLPTTIAWLEVMDAIGLFVPAVVPAVAAPAAAAGRRLLFGAL